MNQDWIGLQLIITFCERPEPVTIYLPGATRPLGTRRPLRSKITAPSGAMISPGPTPTLQSESSADRLFSCKQACYGPIYMHM